MVVLLISLAKIRTTFQLQNNREEKLLAFVLPMFSIHLYIIRADSMDSCSPSCASLPRVLDADFIHLVNGIAYVVHDGIDEMKVSV